MKQERIERVLLKMRENNLSQALISDPFSIAYLTGDFVEPGERFLGLLLREGENPVLVLNRLFTAPHMIPGDIVWYDDTESAPAKVTALTDKNAVLGIDKTLASGFLLELQEAGSASGYKNCSPCIDRVRACKDEEEREKMRIASAMNDEAMRRISARVREGVTEEQLSDELHEIYKELGADGLSFVSIVSFGANAADPHHRPDKTVLKDGDCVLFDIGCIKDSYCSDMTRTFYYKKVNDEQRKIFETVRRANEAAEAIIRPGVRFCDIDATARKVIEDAGYGEYFTHRLGHSIGRQTHEWGDVSSVNTERVCPGMIFSCEPGIYLPGNTGVRIEDLCLVTEDGVEILNKVPHDLKILG